MCMEQSKIQAIEAFLAEVKASKSVSKNADIYRKLNAIVKMAEEKMDEIKPLLIEAKVEEFFDNEKVVYVEGREKSFLDNTLVIREIGQKKFNEIASVTETAIKTSIENSDYVVAISKVVLKETTKPSIKVGKLSKEDKVRLAEKK